MKPSVRAALDRVATFLVPFLIYLVMSSAGFLLASRISDALWATILVDLLVAAMCLWYMKKVRLTTPLKPQPLSRGLWIALIVIFLSIRVFGTTTSSYFISITKDPASMHYIEDMQTPNIFLSLLCTVVVAPVSEELFLRGVAYKSWSQVFGRSAAFIMQACAFTLIHGTLMHLYYTFALALLLALAYEMSDSILVPIGIHALFNLAAILMGSMPLPTAFFNPYVFGVIDLATVSATCIMFGKWISCHKQIGCNRKAVLALPAPKDHR